MNSIHLFCQDKIDRVISCTQMIKEINDHISAGKKRIIFKNTRVAFKIEKVNGKWVGEDVGLMNKDGSFYSDGNQKICKAIEGINFNIKDTVKGPDGEDFITGSSLMFLNCELHFYGFKNCNFHKLQFYNTTTLNTINLDSCDIHEMMSVNYNISIKNSKINLLNDRDPRLRNHFPVSTYHQIYVRIDNSDLKNLSISNLSLLEIEGCTVRGSIQITDKFIQRNEIAFLNIINNKFCKEKSKTKEPFYINSWNWESPYIGFWSLNIKDLKISENTYCTDSLMESNHTPFFEIAESDISTFHWSDEQLASISWEYTNFNHNIRIDKVEVTDFSSMRGIEIPQYNANFTWNTFENTFVLPMNDTLLFRWGKEELLNDFLFGDHISNLKKFHDAFKVRGDYESANAIYVEMKDLESKRFEAQYNSVSNMPAFFKWKLNEFLKLFCDYGTNPIKALIFSFWTILCFALFYFFFYSSWDRIDRTFLIGQHRKLMRYFKSKMTLKEIYFSENKTEIILNQDYKREIKENKNLPFFVRIFGHILHNLSLIRYRLAKFWYSNFEILQNSWDDLDKNQRRKVRIKSIFFILIYLLFLFSIKGLNALFLSINAFSTLGFGDIPVRGFSRYLAILEGFIGWFLLSIFSVSLISQILQG